MGGTGRTQLTKPAIWMVVSSQVIALVRPYVRSGQIDGLISGVYGAASFEQIIQTTWCCCTNLEWLLYCPAAIDGHDHRRWFCEFHRFFDLTRPNEKGEIRMNTLDLIWAMVGFVLSLMIFSYLVGDNPLFRFAASLFIGVTAGYAAVILLYQVIFPD